MAQRLRLKGRPGPTEEREETTMTIRNVMTAEVTACHLNTNLATATALMWEHDCSALPVLTDAGELAGILTDRDICIALGTRNVRASELTAGHVISGLATVCNATDDALVALRKMRAAKIRCLPVVSPDGILEGIVSIDDFVLGERPLYTESSEGEAVSLGDVLRAMQAAQTGSQSIAA
jgi:CBS domain-containing protein